jgi:hypothetical protein
LMCGSARSAGLILRAAPWLTSQHQVGVCDDGTGCTRAWSPQ